VRAGIAPWEPAERKRALWDEEDRVEITDALGVRTLHAAIASYEQALDEVPGHPAARGGLARLYRAQLERAEERREELDRIYFEELVKYYDDGTVLSAMRAEGRLELEVRPPASVTLFAIEEVDRRLQEVRPQSLGISPAGGTVSVPLPPGRHVITVSVDAQVVRLPLLVRAGRTMHAAIDLESGRPEANEVLVPAGPALLDADGGGGLVEVDVPAFYMARYAVTFEEYLAFVASLQRDEPLRAVAHAPRGRDGALYWRWVGEDDGAGEYVPARVATWGTNVAELMRLPVFGIDAFSAEAYASWRSRVSGRNYRLPTEREWEKAGRGTDGRLYPWGDRFDASFCKMRQSRPGLPRPEPVGSFPIDESPYGVRDLAGGIAEWVHPLETLDSSDATQRAMVSRGGAWSDWSVDCGLTARRPYLAVERSSRIGFRLVRSAG
jgi:serine/threonine-protein kinase